MRLVKSLIPLSLSASVFAWPAHAQPMAPVAPPVVSATPIDLPLDEAVSRAVGQSEEVRLAQADVDEAQTRVTQAKAAGLPQVNAGGNYSRTFRSGVSQNNLDFNLPAELRFNPNPTLPLADRVAYLEQAAPLAVLTTLSDVLTSAFQGVGLGSPHLYSVNVNGSQSLYSGGRIGASVRIAENVRDAARLNYREQASEVELGVRTAYYQALLAQELETIAQAALVQAESFLNQERLRLEAGYASDLDVLRAEVSLENIRPQVVEARNAMELSVLNLKRLINIPLQQPVRLTTPLDLPTDATLNEAKLDAATLTAQRPAVQAADRQVAAREQQVRATRGAYKPQVSFNLSWGGQVVPKNMFNFSGGSWSPIATATLGVQIPLFNGFQRGADIGQAQVLLRQTQLQSAQLRESVQLQYEQAVGERERARATIAARQRTVDQAQRVYELTVLRYEQGQATQLEISDARLALLQARTNRAQALSDFYIANAGVMRATGATTAPLAEPTTFTTPKWWSALNSSGRPAAGSQ